MIVSRRKPGTEFGLRVAIYCALPFGNERKGIITSRIGCIARYCFALSEIPTYTPKNAARTWGTALGYDMAFSFESPAPTPA